MNTQQIEKEFNTFLNQVLEVYSKNSTLNEADVRAVKASLLTAFAFGKLHGSSYFAEQTKMAISNTFCNPSSIN